MRFTLSKALRMLRFMKQVQDAACPCEASPAGEPAREERRRHKRVRPDPALILEIALWLDRPRPPESLRLADLGLPDAASSPQERGGPDVENLSAQGLLLSLGEGVQAPEAGSFLYLYLRLARPAHSQTRDSLALMLAAKVVAVRVLASRLLLHLRLEFNAVPGKAEKALHFFNVSRYGVREFTRWCVDLACDPSGCPAPYPGVRLEWLLEEIAQTLAPRDGDIPPQA
jgi:hypothetical protein